MSPHPKKPKRRPRQREIAKKAVDGLSGFLKSRSKLVESPFPPRNQTWKETFWTGTRKPNSYPYSYPFPPKIKFLSLLPFLSLSNSFRIVDSGSN
jgi:hypothetical protein